MEIDVLTSYDLVRRNDGVVVFTFDMPVNCKALLYRQGETYSFRPMSPSEIVGTPNLFMQMLERAGYRVSSNSAILPPPA